MREKYDERGDQENNTERQRMQALETDVVTQEMHEDCV